MNPRLTVLMSAYNEEQFIAQSISSILDQSFEDFEFLIFDDASSDRTRDIIEGFEDQRIRVIENSSNRGLTTNLNEGLMQAKADLVARMDANDLSRHDRFEKQTGIFEAELNVDLVWTGAEYITMSGEWLCQKRSPPLEQVVNLLATSPSDLPVGRNHINHVSVIYRRPTVLACGGYNEDFVWGQDGNLWYRMLHRGAQFRFIDEPLVSIRLVPSSITGARVFQRNIDNNDYYSRICSANGEYSKAFVYALKMPFGALKVRRLLAVAFRYGQSVVPS